MGTAEAEVGWLLARCVLHRDLELLRVVGESDHDGIARARSLLRGRDLDGLDNRLCGDALYLAHDLAVGSSSDHSRLSGLGNDHRRRYRRPSESPGGGVLRGGGIRNSLRSSSSLTSVDPPRLARVRPVRLHARTQVINDEELRGPATACALPLASTAAAPVPQRLRG
eukprot:COSAG02_NODE_3405_length_6797_cov_2.630188_3_plen_168_part_00